MLSLGKLIKYDWTIKNNLQTNDHKDLNKLFIELTLSIEKNDLSKENIQLTLSLIEFRVFNLIIINK